MTRTQGATTSCLLAIKHRQLQTQLGSHDLDPSLSGSDDLAHSTCWPYSPIERPGIDSLYNSRKLFVLQVRLMLWAISGELAARFWSVHAHAYHRYSWKQRVWTSTCDYGDNWTNQVEWQSDMTRICQSYSSQSLLTLRCELCSAKLSILISSPYSSLTNVSIFLRWESR